VLLSLRRRQSPLLLRASEPMVIALLGGVGMRGLEYTSDGLTAAPPVTSHRATAAQAMAACRAELQPQQRNSLPPSREKWRRLGARRVSTRERRRIHMAASITTHASSNPHPQPFPRKGAREQSTRTCVQRRTPTMAPCCCSFYNACTAVTNRGYSCGHDDHPQPRR